MHTLGLERWLMVRAMTLIVTEIVTSVLLLMCRFTFPKKGVQ